MKQKFDMRVRSIVHNVREKEDEEMDNFRILARDEDGVNQIILTTPSRPDGLKAGMTITFTLENPQKTL